MRVIARAGLLALSALATAALLCGPAAAQAPPAAKPASAPPAGTAPAPIAPARPANYSQVLATVNDESITRGELVNFLSRYQIPPGEEATAYKDAVESIINAHLINQYLLRQRIAVPEEKVTQAIDNFKKQLAQDGNDLATEILRTGVSMDEVRKEFATRIRWIEFLNQRATDAELKKFASSHEDLFNGTKLRASHILLKVDPKASPADKEAIKARLLSLKKDIEAGKATFAAAANKHSEDPANSEGAGGDVGYFDLSSGFIEEFANAAFALKKGAISEPIETPYGFHLIQVTDRKQGAAFDFAQNIPLVKQAYSAELQKQLLQAQRKDARIDIKPMPTDFFPPAPTGAAPAAAAPASAAPKASKPK